MGVALRPPHQGWLILLAGVVIGMLLGSGIALVTWQLCHRESHQEYLRLQASADSINAAYQRCLQRDCIFPRERRP